MGALPPECWWVLRAGRRVICPTGEAEPAGGEPGAAGGGEVDQGAGGDRVLHAEPGLGAGGGGAAVQGAAGGGHRVADAAGAAGAPGGRGPPDPRPGAGVDGGDVDPGHRGEEEGGAAAGRGVARGPAAAGARAGAQPPHRRDLPVGQGADGAGGRVGPRAAGGGVRVGPAEARPRPGGPAEAAGGRRGGAEEGVRGPRAGAARRVGGGAAAGGRGGRQGADLLHAGRGRGAGRGRRDRRARAAGGLRGRRRGGHRFGGGGAPGGGGGRGADGVAALRGLLQGARRAVQDAVDGRARARAQRDRGLPSQVEAGAWGAGVGRARGGRPDDPGRPGALRGDQPAPEVHPGLRVGRGPLGAAVQDDRHAAPGPNARHAAGLPRAHRQAHGLRGRDPRDGRARAGGGGAAQGARGAEGLGLPADVLAPGARHRQPGQDHAPDPGVEGSHDGGRGHAGASWTALVRLAMESWGKGNNGQAVQNPYARPRAHRPSWDR